MPIMICCIGILHRRKYDACNFDSYCPIYYLHYRTLIQPGEIVHALFIIVWISMLAELVFYERSNNDNSSNW